MERGVLVQRSMGPRHIIIGGISAWGPAQVRFAKHDHVVETFAADRADESLNVSILPRRSGCDRMVPDAHCTDPLQEDWSWIRHEVQRHWVHALQRRGQRQRISWVYLSDRPWFELPSARTLHPAV